MKQHDGKVYKYKVPKEGRRTAEKQAQQQTKDRNHGPNWEVGVRNRRAERSYW